ncbi:hypothetical protein HII28_02275 [Planctomonas sp. JC2975]|uniref:P63C domain-containing protein n=1 Tax=Planctomonas sp. JC2975 TaxID=2729626 RepID=UPI001472800E|nr:P63C domain-containing protein [Planctomonas sp. JC2975]NNC10714.1 hypothetical protein [Planctomonas sp. JC2975]
MTGDNQQASNTGLFEAEGRAAGGKARAASMSADERREVAKKGAAARWAEIPTVYAGSVDRPLIIGDIEIECYVLDDGTRVITQGALLRALGRHTRAAGTDADDVDPQLPPILQGKAIRPYTAGIGEEAHPVAFRLPQGSRANGYRAELLPKICEVYLAARSDRKLPANQQRIATQAEILIRGLATVGIIALVDEATGYQEIRTKDALSRILQAFVAKELQPWVKTFPADFYKEMFRLRGLPYDPASVQRPQYFGNLTNDIVYDRLAPAVRDELKREQAKSAKTGRMFQYLTTDIGYPKLREHLGSVVTLMKLSSNYAEFKAKLDLIHPSYKKNMPAPLWLDASDLGL